MLTKDDDDWLALLAGKEVQDAEPQTVREVSALKEALHTELQWQKLRMRIQADKNKAVVEAEPKFRQWLQSLVAGIHDLLEQKILSFGGAVYTAFVVVLAVVLSLITEQKPSPNQTDYRPKGQDVVEPSDSIGPIMRLKLEPQTKANEMKQNFESSGAAVQVTKINDKAFQVDISMPETPSQALGDLCDIENIDLSSNRSVSIVIISPE
ncbi:MAG TPA: hypothetical protein ENG03_01410 [Thioploca sp.]|nr:MAG: hypothetical protein DRR19_20710 [Gammaproteobacteria bacterium]HDN25757.1 hypothetical protein [Thioploca sp.]